MSLIVFEQLVQRGDPALKCCGAFGRWSLVGGRNVGGQLLQLTVQPASSFSASCSAQTLTISLPLQLPRVSATPNAMVDSRPSNLD